MPLKGPDLELMTYTKQGNHPAMKAVLRPGPSSPLFANVDAFDGDDTPLSAAIHRKDYEAMRILLAASANPNLNLESDDRYDGSDGATPLMLALSDPAAVAIILAHMRYEPGLDCRNLKGEALVGCIPESVRSEIYALLALYFGDEKQGAELRAKADVAGATLAKPKPKPRKKAT